MRLSFWRLYPQGPLRKPDMENVPMLGKCLYREGRCRQPLAVTAFNIPSRGVEAFARPQIHCIRGNPDE